MTVWMDMTNSLRVWQGGVVGIIRAELEVASQYKKLYPDLKFSVFDGSAFREVKDNELNWLFSTNCVTDAYLQVMGRVKPDSPASTAEAESGTSLHSDSPSPRQSYPALDAAYHFSPSRLIRFRQFVKLTVDAMPRFLKPIVRVTGSAAYFLLKLVSSARVQVKNIHAKVKNNKRVPFPPAPTFTQPAFPEDMLLTHPYAPGDIVFSMGWVTSGKERAFTQLKDECENICLIYLIYDLILINKGTTHLYDQRLVDQFQAYFEWASINCDLLLYGGKTAENDGTKYQEVNDLPVVPSAAVKFGSNILATGSIEYDHVRKKYKLADRFIISVGTVEPRKNYDTIYKAYTILADSRADKDIPQLLIIGNQWADNFIVELSGRDPRTADKIRFLNPTDAELDLLYKYCLFVIQPSLYEGWNLTLPEALSYGKCCVVSDVPPLREIGGNLVEYIPPLDVQNPMAWAKKIIFLVDNPEEIRKREVLVKNGYTPNTWSDCARQIHKAIEARPIPKHGKPLYFDLTLTWHQMLAGFKIAGILRTELMLLRYLSRIKRDMRFFAMNHIHGYQKIDRYSLRHLLGKMDLDTAYELSRSEVGRVRVSGVSAPQPAPSVSSPLAAPFWMFCSLLSGGLQQKIISFMEKRRLKASRKALSNVAPPDTSESTEGSPVLKSLPFHSGVIFSAGTGNNLTFTPMLEAKKASGFKLVQVLYDFTPMLIPQTHLHVTVKYYTEFIEYASRISDLILYGGKTAMKDGEKYMADMGLPIPKGCPIRFGGDIKKIENNPDRDEDAMLGAMGITGDFILTVGTIQLRKNHDVLYKAYLRLIEDGVMDELPQVVFAGGTGWKTEDMTERIHRDKRLHHKIVYAAPTDEQLDLLYRRCMFTLLPSLYEGWSLTLPEALEHGKFCLTSDTPALKEIGGNLLDYIQPYDVAGWADKIYYYTTHPEALAERENKIIKEWKHYTWKDCAMDIFALIEPLLDPDEEKEQK